MGGIIAKNQPSIPFEKSKEEIVKLVLPVYYTEETITPRDQQLVIGSWNMIVNDTAPEYLEEKKSANFRYENCVSYFCHLFYEQLFRIHPESKPLFEHALSMNEMASGKVLVKMITMFLKMLDNDADQGQMLTKFAEQHYSRGVKAVQYGVFGEILFYALQGTMGFDYYSFEVHQAWVKLYSHLLKTMIPVAVGCECEEFQSSMPFTVKDLEKKEYFS